jgi:hypothetical protein
MLPEAGGGSDGVGDPVAEQCRLLQQLAHPRAAATWQSSFHYFISRNDRTLTEQELHKHVVT